MNEARSNSYFEGGPNTDAIQAQLTAAEADFKVQDAAMASKLPPSVAGEGTCGKNCTPAQKASVDARNNYSAKKAALQGNINSLKAKLQASKVNDVTPDNATCPSNCPNGCSIVVDAATSFLKINCK